MPGLPIKKCGNCDLPIGKLESIYEWKGHAICSACHQKITAERMPHLIEKQPRFPLIFKVAAWLIVIAILIYTLDSYMKWHNRVNNDRDEEFRLTNR